MQFKVPQNIDMQDRIIGPLTLSQFFYLLFGAIIIYILFTHLMPAGLGFIFFVLAVPVGAISFSLAFVKINDRPFSNFLISGLNFLLRPRQRVWHHFEKAPSAQPVIKKQPEKGKAVPKKELDTVRVRELAKILDNPKREGDG